MRSMLFNAVYKSWAVLVAAVGLGLTALPWRGPMAWTLRQWARSMLFLMRRLVGVRVVVRGQRHIPPGRPVVFASKHQSECDGIIMLAHMPGLAVVATQRLGRMPLIGHILRRLQMILVNTDGRTKQLETLLAGARKVHAQGRSILIYPEGTLMAVGHKERYRSGIYHVAKALGAEVVPIATNAGLCWDRDLPEKRPGTIVTEILPPMRAGDDEAAFMQRLEEVIERRTAALVTEGRVRARSEAAPAGCLLAPWRRVRH